MNGFLKPSYYDQRIDGLQPTYVPTPQQQLHHASVPMVAPQAMRFMQQMPQAAPPMMMMPDMRFAAQSPIAIQTTVPQWSGVQGPNYKLKMLNNAPPMMAPGQYYPPGLPYRYPAAPYDNPTYSAFPSMVMMPLPAPYRSDPLNRLSDGGHYAENMQKYDHFQTNGVDAGAPASL
eukprot:TRINITY_DN43355_c0_g1_i2.p1 TRINITY_DN43355_c0_g1~~TRINITY_DN43355_c0_g1_i2.p1  ORF type:complete len:175 (+),score=82.10 TRINITY_DN43355_c0_g1_i2:263-787(+)